MDHLLVDGRADRAGKAVIALEGRHAAGVPDDRLGDRVEVGGRYAGRDRFAHPGEGGRDDEPGGPHLHDLLRGLQLDAQLVSSHIWRLTAV
jgi:hypothetical protein